MDRRRFCLAAMAPVSAALFAQEGAPRPGAFDYEIGQFLEARLSEVPRPRLRR